MDENTQFLFVFDRLQRNLFNIRQLLMLIFLLNFKKVISFEREYYGSFVVAILLLQMFCFEFHVLIVCAVVGLLGQFRNQAVAHVRLRHKAINITFNWKLSDNILLL